MKKQTEHWLLNLAGLLLLLFLITGIWLGIELRKDVYDCYEEPIKCGAERIADTTGESVFISISVQGYESQTYYIEPKTSE